MNVRRRCR